MKAQKNITKKTNNVETENRPMDRVYETLKQAKLDDLCRISERAGKVSVYVKGDKKNSAKNMLMSAVEALTPNFKSDLDNGKLIVKEDTSAAKVKKAVKTTKTAKSEFAKDPNRPKLKTVTSGKKIVQDMKAIEKAKTAKAKKSMVATVKNIDKAYTKLDAQNVKLRVQVDVLKHDNSELKDQIKVRDLAIKNLRYALKEMAEASAYAATVATDNYKWALSELAGIDALLGTKSLKKGKAATKATKKAGGKNKK